MGWSKKYKRSIDCNNPKGFSQKAHCAGRKKRENVMSSKLEELVGKPITEEQFDEAAGKKDACYHKVKARYDVWPSAYASGALVKCRKVGAKNWGNKSKKEGVNETTKMKPQVKKLLKQKGYSPIFQAIDTSKRQFKQMRYSRGEIQDTLIDMFGDEDPKILQKIREGLGEVSDVQKRKIYKKAFGKEYDDSKRKQTPLPLDIAYKAALNKLKKKEGLGEAKQRTSVGKSELSREIKKIRRESPSKYFKPMGDSLVRSLAHNLNATSAAIYKSMIKYNVGTEYIKGISYESLGDRMAKKLKKHKGVNLKKKKIKEDVFFESTTENGMTTNHVYYEIDGKGYGYTLEFSNDLNEAEYQGRKVKLGKIMQGDVKKFKVYVKNPKGNVVKVNFGQGGGAKGGTMRIRKSNPKARANFRARHNCDNPGPRHKARYWSCRKW